MVDSPITRPQARVRDELFGALHGLASLPSLIPTWSSLPRGRGQPVLVLPGFMTSDHATVVLRQFLRRLGYAVHGWGLGRNHGRLEKLVPPTLERIATLEARYGQPLRLVGWSLGGVVARESARQQPTRVRQIITMGTPVVGGAKYTAAGGRYERAGVDLDALERRVAQRNAMPIAVPITCIYSKRDAIVAWKACFDPNPDNEVEYVEVDLMHSALGLSSQVFEIVAHRLATG